MCQFFSLCSDGNGKPYYFDWEIRAALLKSNPKDYEHDSHTSIADYYGFKNEKEDELNKYEFNPFIGKFTIDQMNTKDDSKKIEEFCRILDFKNIVKPMTIKKIINPFEDMQTKEVSEDDILLLKNVASVSVRTSVRDSVMDSVGASVRASVWASVWDSVWASVRASVRASVMAQIGSMFNLKKWKYCENIKTKGYPFQSYVDLWNKGLVPSFYDKEWRLHGHKGKILWTSKDGKIEL